MTRTVHGKTIGLDEDPGLAEGQDVEIVLKAAGTRRAWGEGIPWTAGAPADDPGWGGFMQEIDRGRHGMNRSDKQPWEASR